LPVTGISELSLMLVAQDLEVRLPTVGASMYPCLAPGDQVTVSGLRGREPSLGDILLVAQAGRLWCHRLVRAETVDACRWYWTRGDAHGRPDEPVTAEQIVGIVRRIERGRVSAGRRALLLIHQVLTPRLFGALLGGWRTFRGGSRLPTPGTRTRTDEG
jgi:hypothetical protein